MKKLLSVLLALVMVLSLLPMGVISVSAATSGTTGDCTWTLDDEGTLTISGEGEMGNYIESDYDTSATFQSRPWGTEITSVVIEDGVTGIGKGAFANSTNLTRITIGNDVTRSGYWAFYNCTNLTEVYTTDLSAWCNIDFPCNFSYEYAYNVSSHPLNSRGGDLYINNTKLGSHLEIPDSVTTIKEGTFLKCTGLTSVTIPNSVTTIDDGAFSGCSGLNSVTIPNSVTKIGECAFEKCTNLKTLTIGEGVALIEGPAFVNCTNLTTVNFDAKNCRYSLYSWGAAFERCSNLTTVIFGENVESIPGSLFSACTALTSITIPDSVKSINTNFYGTALYNDSTNWENNVLYINNHLIAANNISGAYTVKNGTKTIAKSAFSSCNGITKLTIPDSVTHIGDYAFSGCSRLTIYGLPGSTAESYAAENGIPFEKKILSIEATLPKLTYLEGKDTLDVSSGTLTLYYNESKTNYEEINLAKAIISSFDNTKVGMQTLTVTYEGLTTTFDVEIVPKSITSIAVTTTPSQYTYIEGKDTLSVRGGKITATYDNGDTELIDITTDMVSGFDNSKVGKQTLTVTYDGKTTTFEVEVIAKSLSGIAVTTNPSKLTYLEAKDALDVSGGKVTLYYNNDTTAVIDLTADMVSGFSNTMVGEQTLMVIYGGYTTTYSVEVIAKTLTSIAVTTKPTNPCYVGTPLDTTGMVVTAYYDNGSSNEITGYTVKADFTIGGDATVTITYGGKTATFGVWVENKTITAIVVTKKPTKLTYIEGSRLDTTGMVVTAYYNNGTFGEITDYYVEADLSYPGSALVIVSCEGNIDDFIVTVRQKTVTSLSLIAHPDKLNYTEGNSLSTNGGKLKVSYNNDTTETMNLTTDMVSGYDPNRIGLQILTVNYGGHTATFSVVVAHDYAAATCGKPQTCRACGSTTGSATGKHDNKTTIIPATLSKDGSKVTKCSVCGTQASKSTIKKIKTVKLSAAAYTYDGKAKSPSVAVKDSAGETLKKNTDYTDTYAKGRKNVGSYKVTVTFKGNYSGKKVLTFKINPPKTAVSKVAAAKKSLKVTISKKTTQVTGYEVQYATSKSFKSAKTKVIKSAKTTSLTIKSLKAKKTYYVRVRTYKTVSGKKYYSAWSAAKSKKTK